LDDDNERQWEDVGDPPHKNKIGDDVGGPRMNNLESATDPSAPNLSCFLVQHLESRFGNEVQSDIKFDYSMLEMKNDHTTVAGHEYSSDTDVEIPADYDIESYLRNNDVIQSNDDNFSNIPVWGRRNEQEVLMIMEIISAWLGMN